MIKPLAKVKKMGKITVYPLGESRGLFSFSVIAG